MKFRELLKTESFINGSFTSTEESTGKLQVLDKYNQKTIAEISLASQKSVQQTIHSATQATPLLSQQSAAQRSANLLHLKELLQQERDKFIALIVTEAGKPLSYAQAEVDRSLLTLQLAAEEAIRFTGETVPMDFGKGVGKSAFTKRFPIGPITAISPFNFPLNLALHKIAPAIAVGCPIIVKPSPLAPLTTLAFAALAEKTDLPKGALNVVICETAEAEILIRDPRTKMLSFTGSPKIGWHLKNISGQKRTILELGGNAAVIVDKSCDLEAAAKSIAMGAYLYAGQICISTQRIYVEKSIFCAFLKLLQKEIANLKVGDPKEAETIVGPLINRTHLNRVKEWVDEAKAEGAEILTGGNIADEEHNLFQPTLMTNTKPQMKVVAEEVFAPVAIIESYDHFEEALNLVNDSKYGLQAGVFTNQIDQMKKAHNQLEVGAVIINDAPGFRIDSMPYGGVKNSGLGREGLKYSMHEMTESRLLIY